MNECYTTKCKNQAVMTIDGDRLCASCAKKRCEGKKTECQETIKADSEQTKNLFKLIKENTCQ